MPAYAQRRVHSGKESTFGTNVAATNIWGGVNDVKPTFLSTRNERKKYLDGTLNPASLLIQTGEGGGFTLDQDFILADSIAVFLSSLTTTTPTGAGPYVWTFPFPYSSAITLQSRTFEFYDGVGTSYRADGSLCTAFGISAQAGADQLVKLSSTWESTKISKQTVTSLSTIRTPVTLPTGFGTLYLDALGGTMGATVQADTLIEWDLSFSGLTHMKRFQSGSLSPTAYGADSVPSIVLNTKLEFNATGVAGIDAFLAATGKLIQIKTTTGASAILTVEGAFHPTEATILDNRDGNTICNVKWEAFYDSTYAKVGQIIVTNSAATVFDT